MEPVPVSQEPVYPTLQPSPGKITFTSTRDNGYGSIYVVNSDGTGLTRITPPEWVAIGSRWVPGCHSVIFDTSDGIYVVKPDGSGLKQLIELSEHTTFTLSPDGEKIVFSAPDENFPRGGDIWTMNIDGTGVRQLVHCDDRCSNPIWHPDGKSIFYFSHENDYTDLPVKTTLYRSDAQGTNHKMWLSPSETADIPSLGMHSISPDGGAFVLVKEVDEVEHTDIFTLSIETKEWSPLTNDQAYYDYPAWSPDGQQIVYVNYRVPSEKATRPFPIVSGLWIMNLDGSARFRVVGPEGKNIHPDWCAP
jgi:TolB protein